MRIVFTSFVCAVSLAAAAAAAEWYVAPHGSDANPGTEARPFATLERARDAVRSRKRDGRTLPGRTTVFLADGVYRLDHPLVFAPEDSGTAESPVTYLAQPGAKPIVSGGRRTEGWRKHDARLWVADVAWAAERREPLTQLFVNGRRRIRARTPNAGQYFYTKRLTRRATHGGPCRGMTAALGDLKPWTTPDDRVVCLFHNWVNSYNYVKEADWQRRRLTFTRLAGVFFLGPSIRYYVENALEYLDVPGEWYLDRGQGKLFYYPAEGEDLAQAEVIAPALVQTLVKVVGEPALGLYVEHLVFRGLSFQHTDADLSRDYAHSVQGAHTQKGAFFAVGMRHSIIEDCEFTRLGEHAVSLREARAWNAVRRGHVHDVGGGGVYLSEGAPKRTDDWYLTAHNTIENNFIHDGGHIFRAGCGVFLGGSASHNRIAHNEICDLSWMGVHLGWSWTGLRPAYTHHNEVAYNRIHHLGNGVLNDIGGIYTLGVSPGTVLHHNLIHDITRFERGRQGYGGWGIYLDAGSSEIVVENNVVYNTRDGGLHLHCHSHPYGDLIRNNVFAYSDEGQLMRNANHEPDGNHAHLERNIVYNANARMLWGSNWKPDSKFTSDRNCFWSETGEPQLNDRSLSEWQKTGRDAGSIVADPGVVAPSNRDFRLKPGSPALALGFEPIDLSKVGLHGSSSWRSLPQGVTHRPYEAAPPPKADWPIREDAEDYGVGERPDGAVPDEGGARVAVTDQQPASGRQCLRFEDAPGVTVWKPHWCVWFKPRPDRLRLSCMVRNDSEQPGTIGIEFRDWPRGGAQLHTGPHLRLLPGGAVRVLAADSSWTEVGTYPLGEWVRVEIQFAQGKDDLGPWALRLIGQDGTLVERDDLSMRSLDFRACTWFGIVGADTRQAVFDVDDIVVE